MKKITVVLLIFIFFITGCKATISLDLNTEYKDQSMSDWQTLNINDDLFSITVYN